MLALLSRGCALLSWSAVVVQRCRVDLVVVLQVAVATFATFVTSDPENNLLTPETAFVSLALFNLLRFPMTMLPMLISFMIQCSVSNKRVKTFLAAEELDPCTVDKAPKDQGWFVSSLR